MSSRLLIPRQKKFSLSCSFSNQSCHLTIRPQGRFRSFLHSFLCSQIESSSLFSPMLFPQLSHLALLSPSAGVYSPSGYPFPQVMAVQWHDLLFRCFLLIAPLSLEDLCSCERSVRSRGAVSFTPLTREASPSADSLPGGLIHPRRGSHFHARTRAVSPPRTREERRTSLPRRVEIL